MADPSASPSALHLAREEEALLTNFASSLKSSKRLPPCGVFVALRDGLSADFSVAPMSVLHRCVKFVGVTKLHFSFADDVALAQQLAEHPISDRRRAAVRSVAALTNGEGVASLRRNCFALLPSLLHLGLAIHATLTDAVADAQPSVRASFVASEHAMPLDLERNAPVGTPGRTKDLASRPSVCPPRPPSATSALDDLLATPMPKVTSSSFVALDRF